PRSAHAHARNATPTTMTLRRRSAAIGRRAIGSQLMESKCGAARPLGVCVRSVTGEPYRPRLDPTDRRSYADAKMLPLDHIRVLALPRLAPGPHCTMILADLGADVIRVEEPGGGRRAEMERARTSESERVAERRQAAFNALNRNKRSITLNLKLPAPKQAFHDMAREADVVVEGFRPGVVARLGVDYVTLSTLKPRLLFGSICVYDHDWSYPL